MKKDSIEYLAYLLNKAKVDGKDKAIVFIGAGTSVSAGIPQTYKIVRHIKLKFINNPLIKNNTSKDYYELMNALTADERRDLFHFYVTRDKVKLNIANVYLAQLLKLGYIDYIVTVNFDDLILKACTLYNFLPPVYDISNIKTITTTDIRTNSVIYLHGQYFGQWLLNNQEELNKVENEILGLFNTIKTRRTWLVVGYSGNDGIFEKIKALGSFSNDLFWVKKDFSNKEDKHVLDFISTPNVNAHKIEGFYADSFFLKLHAELAKLDNKLETPDLFNKPFTHLKSIMQTVNEIDDKDELGAQVKNIVENCYVRIEKAIAEFESKESLEGLKQRIIDSILKSEFNDEIAKSFENEIKAKTYTEAKEQLSWYYINWGNTISELAKKKKDENLFFQSFKKFEKANELNPKNDSLFNNWGITLTHLAKVRMEESPYLQSIEKYKIGSELNPNNPSIYNNWGNTLSHLAKLKNDENLYLESIEKYKIASSLNPKNYRVFLNWGISLSNLAAIRQDENLFEQSFEKLKLASELNPKKDSIFIIWGDTLRHLANMNNDENLFLQSIEKYEIASLLNSRAESLYFKWGISLFQLAAIRNDEDLFEQSFEKFKSAIEINPQKDSIFTMWGNALVYLATLKEDEDLFNQSFEKYDTASKLNPKNYFTFFYWGISLRRLARIKNDEYIYNKCFEKFQIAYELDNSNYFLYTNWGDALTDLATLNKDENLFLESSKMYERANELVPKNYIILGNWGYSIMEQAKINNKETLWNEAENLLKESVSLGGDTYYLACLYAQKKDKEKALINLEKALENDEVEVSFIEKEDDNWENLKNNIDFIKLLDKYR